MKKLIISLIAILFIACSHEKKDPIKPNIILIYADDLGRGMLGTYGQEIITTPNIDKLANQGMRFNNVYGCHYCAPARASLLTGMHDVHPNQWNITKGGIYMKLDNGLSMQEITDSIHKMAKPAREDEVFMAQIAQNAGYTTAEFGKLEWGFATTPKRIIRHGWDYHFGYYDHQRCHGFFPPFLFENGEKIDIPGNTHANCAKTYEYETPENYKQRWDMTGKKVYSEYVIVDKLLAFMDDHNPKETEKPFFIYFPSQLPHGPVSVPEVDPELKDNPNLTELEKEYGTMVKILDSSVGKIYAKCEELGILDNTIIVFTGDNGHEIYTSQKGRCEKGKTDLKGVPFDNIKTKFYSEVNGDVFNGNDGMAGLKRSNWEGGVRVPLIWHWKGKIKAGSTSDQLVANYDLLNTFAEFMGQTEEQGIDGISYAKTVLGRDSKIHDYTVYQSKLGPAIVTNDGWKLRLHEKANIYQLYHLPDDYREENELSHQYPEKAEELKALLSKERS